MNHAVSNPMNGVSLIHVTKPAHGKHPFPHTKSRTLHWGVRRNANVSANFRAAGSVNIP